MFFIIEYLKRQFFVTIIVVLLGAYTVADQFGYGQAFKDNVTASVMEYIPDLAPHMDKVKEFLNNLKSK